jgi:GNAT superfamily N-acetyltransferase
MVVGDTTKEPTMRTTIDTTQAARRASADEAPQLGRTLARAFLDDPVSRFIVPDVSRRYERLLRGFTDVYVGKIGAASDLMYTTPGYEGVAMWQPPEDATSGVVESLLLIPSLVRALRGDSIRALRSAADMEKHHPDEPHYTLFFIGTDPAHQGKGVGARLMRPMLERLDREGAASFLESSTRRNHSFYRRHGYELTGEFELPGGGPPLWTFWREPGAAGS